MSIIVEGSIASTELVLYEVTREHSEIRLEVNDIVATDPRQPAIFLWAGTTDPATFAAAAVEDPTVAEIETYTELPEKTLFRAVVAESATVVTYPQWVDRGASLLSATCQAGVWRWRMRFPDRDALEDVIDWAKSEGIAVTISGLYDDYKVAAGAGNGLSPEQEQTLRRAQEMGHYEIPQRATAGEVAEELDVSQQAVSERLRRAYATLVQRHVLDGTE